MQGVHASQASVAVATTNSARAISRSVRNLASQLWCQCKVLSTPCKTFRRRRRPKLDDSDRGSTTYKWEYPTLNPRHMRRADGLTFTHCSHTPCEHLSQEVFTRFNTSLRHCSHTRVNTSIRRCSYTFLGRFLTIFGGQTLGKPAMVVLETRITQPEHSIQG